MVCNSIPDNSIAVGIPAKVIRNVWDYAEKVYEQMPEDWDNEQYKNNMKDYLQTVIPEPPKV